MQLFQYTICFLTLLVISPVISAAAHNADTSHQPSTFSELRKTLHELGYKSVERLQKPQPSKLPHAENKGCVKTCIFLTDLLGNLVSNPGSGSYVQQQSAYWSKQQAETQPACRVQPKHAQDVAAALLIIKFFHCQFAVKSGGHAASAGASGIQGGLTIHLFNLRTLQVSKDKTTTYIGAGNRWGDVYRALSSLNLAVIGGRDAVIGVGGLTLGGEQEPIRHKDSSDISCQGVYLSYLAAMGGRAMA
ncbi:hypothetical protein MMC22_006644 [Lobaria immixta]|nr:hypothetical protein [Lobaria immixta]